MEDFKGGLFLIVFGIFVFCVYYIYCRIDRFRFTKKWKNLDLYCRRNNYYLNGGARHQINYIKELTRKEVKELLDSLNIECDLPHDIRYFDNIVVTSVKPYTNQVRIRGYGEIIEHHGGERTHRFLTLQKFEKGEWTSYYRNNIYSSFKPYIDADFGGMHNKIYKTDSQKEIESKLHNELNNVLRDFVSIDIEQWNEEKRTKEVFPC